MWERHVPKAIKNAGLAFHWLRKSAVATLAEAECTTEEIKAIAGQSTAMVAHCAKGVNQKNMAEAAVLKWEKR